MAGLAVGGIVIALWLLLRAATGPAPQLAQLPAPGAVPPVVASPVLVPPVLPLGPAKPVVAEPPSFDVAMVSPGGTGVFAGRAAPGAVVSLHDGDKVLGQATANEGGSWVIAPNAPVPPGPHRFTLSAVGADGHELAASGAVLMTVPATGQAPVAVAAAAGEAPRVLSGKAGSPTLDAVQYDDTGAMKLAGRAPSGVKLRLYVDNAPAGDAQTDAEGHWALASPLNLAPGAHKLRLDQIDPQGHVVARVETPFQRAATQGLAEGQAVVQPGQSLWRLARNAYGNGASYIVIYRANQRDIRNPALIYPGQVLAVPTGSTAAPAPPSSMASSPDSSSRSR